MTPLRRLLRDHPALAAWLVVVALAMKILVPGGFMPVVANGVLTIQLCAGVGPSPSRRRRRRRRMRRCRG
ncbi:hypothetical protein QTN93_18930 [Sphingomonas aerolata]|uniref:hypothetical protein n=1 Tax=Sphingomonas aerolata TaxID=185951 RepID=UPI0035A61440